MSPGIRVALIDDHELTAESLGVWLAGRVGITFVGSAPTAATGRCLIEDQHPDVVLLDLGLPDSDDLDLLREFHAAGVTVVVVTGWDEDVFAAETMRAGAMAFVPKGLPGRELLAAITAAADGRRWLSPRLTQASFKALWPSKTEPTELKGSADSLTDRELTVLELTGRGLGLKDIADNLGISVKTVDTHRRNIREKLGLEAARHLIAYAALWWTRTRGR